MNEALTRSQAIKWCKDLAINFMRPTMYLSPKGWMWTGEAGMEYVLEPDFSNRETVPITRAELEVA